MELQKASVKLPHTRLMQQTILRKTHFVRIDPISPSRKLTFRNMEEPAFNFGLLSTNEPQLRKSEELFSPFFLYFLIGLKMEKQVLLWVLSSRAVRKIPSL